MKSYTSLHHLVPSSRGGTYQAENIRRITHNFHVAFHRVFENRMPHEQIDMLADFNQSAFTLDARVRINELLKDLQDTDYVYRK